MKKFVVKSTTMLIAAGLGLSAASAWSAESLQDVMKRRNLSQQDLLAASKTYVPTGKRDDFVAFASGAPAGQAQLQPVKVVEHVGAAQQGRRAAGEPAERTKHPGPVQPQAVGQRHQRPCAPGQVVADLLEHVGKLGEHAHQHEDDHRQREDDQEGRIGQRPQAP